MKARMTRTSADGRSLILRFRNMPKPHSNRVGFLWIAPIFNKEKRFGLLLAEFVVKCIW